MHLKRECDALALSPVTRRRFLKQAAYSVGAVSAALSLPQAGCAQDQTRSVVVIAHHPGATTADGQRVKEPIAKLVDAVVTRLSGETDVAKAWEKYFSSDETVGIKVNGLGGPLIATARELSEVCVERLTGIGVKPEKIIIWDSNDDFLRSCGLNPGRGDWGTQVLPMSVEWDPPLRHGSFNGQVTSIVTKRVDAYLSLPIMKDHGAAGITMALKSHYGTIINPADHHRNNCDPYIADVNTIPAIRDKQRLIICDSTRATCEGGPGFRAEYVWSNNKLLCATDPVAHDTVGWRLIEAQRKLKGLPPLEAVGRPPKQIASAATRGLGTNDPQQIDVQTMEVT